MFSHRVTPLIIYSTYGKVRKAVLVILPRKGYKCLTVSDKVHEDIKNRAKESKRNMREYVEYLLAKEKVAKDGK